MSPKIFFRMLKALGLDYSHLTGGYLPLDAEQSKFSELPNKTYRICFASGENITLVEPEAFHSSILTAEKSLELKLFS